jgi:hypothetical protein
MEKFNDIVNIVPQRTTLQRGYGIMTVSERRQLLNGFIVDQDQKDFNKEIKNVKHDRILYEYPQESVDSIIKPARSNGPSSDIIYLDIIIIPNGESIFEKLRRI